MTIYNYKTKDGKAKFEFGFKQWFGCYRIYILKHPWYINIFKLRFRNNGGVRTHRYTDGDGKKYMCIIDSCLPRTIDRCKDYAEYWAENTWIYIKTGKRFN